MTAVDTISKPMTTIRDQMQALKQADRVTGREIQRQIDELLEGLKDAGLFVRRDGECALRFYRPSRNPVVQFFRSIWAIRFRLEGRGGDEFSIRPLVPSPNPAWCIHGSRAEVERFIAQRFPV